MLHAFAAALTALPLRVVHRVSICRAVLVGGAVDGELVDAAPRLQGVAKRRRA